MEDHEAYNRAKKRAEAKLGFYVHLSVYIVVCTLLVVINLFTSPDQMWAIWPLMGWGIGLLFHALSVFVFHGPSGVTERMIEREFMREV